MNGEGSVYKRASDGRWVGAVTLGYDDRGKRIRKTVSATTKAAVFERLRAVQRQVSEGLPVPDDRVTVSELLDRWQNDVLRHQVAESAYMNYTAIGDHHIRPALGSTRLAKLTPADVDALLSRKLDDGYSVSTVRRIRAVLAQTLAQGERWGLVVRNVAAVTRGPRDRRRQGRTLTPEQAQTLLAALKGDRYEALFTTMLALGLRRGEALGLRWADIDLEKGTLTVRHALKRESTGLVLGEVKTTTSRRAVNLPAPLVTTLAAHRKRQLESQLAAPEWENGDFVFTTQTGSPLDPRNIYRACVGITERAGLGRWHPHELRHSAASIMLAAGVPIEVVSNILGHSSIRVTADVYGHILDPQRQKAAEAMAGALWS